MYEIRHNQKFGLLMPQLIFYIAMIACQGPNLKWFGEAYQEVILFISDFGARYTVTCRRKIP